MKRYSFDDMGDMRKERLYEGHVPLEEALAEIPMTTRKRVELWLILLVIAVVRPFFRLYRKLTGNVMTYGAGLEGHHQVAHPILGHRRKETHGGHYLTEAQAKSFERDGVIGPLPLLSPTEADSFRARMYELHERDWNGQSILGAEVVAKLKAQGNWNIAHGGLWMGLAVNEIRDLAHHPITAQRVASILGDDVVAWRTQLFEVQRQTHGTFWHSATTFTEDGDLPILAAPDEVPPGLVNISLWVALEDVTLDNACLRFVPGSYNDVRFDRAINQIQQDKVGFLMDLDATQRKSAVLALRYSSDIFLGAQLAFDVALERMPDLYRDTSPADYVMKAGECVLFSSNNLHGSRPNSTDSDRLAFGSRYARADIEVFPGQDTFPYNVGNGPVWVDAEPIRQTIDVHTNEGAVAAPLTVDLTVASATGEGQPSDPIEINEDGRIISIDSGPTGSA